MKVPQGLAVSITFGIAILAIMMAGFVIHDIANGCLFSKCPITPATPANQSEPSPPSQPSPAKNEPAKTVAWDGHPDHYDCSPEGHLDPKHPDRRISDENEYDDKPCVPNAPIPPRVDPLADGGPPDTYRCFGPGWGMLPDQTEGDRKCNPMRQKQLAKDDRVEKVFGETATHARWVDSPDTKTDDLDEVYELRGEDGHNACAEVTHTPSVDGAYRHHPLKLRVVESKLVVVHAVERAGSPRTDDLQEPHLFKVLQCGSYCGGAAYAGIPHQSTVRDRYKSRIMVNEC
jgi:hypothetical protein